jgi:cyanophycin synthetase
MGRAEPALNARDPIVSDTLSGQGLSRDAIPPAGASVLVRNLPMGRFGGRELPTVYDEDVTHCIAPALIEELQGVVTAVGSRYAGVDIITTDPSVSLAKSGGAFIELNTSPGLHQHYLSADGVEHHALAARILGRLLGCG